MKKFILLVTIVLSTQSIYAQQNCNSDPNKIITGMPYCDSLKINSTSTVQQPSPLKETLIDRDRALQEKLEIFSILNSNKHSPHIPYRKFSNMPSPKEELYNPNLYQPYINNNQIQPIPNTPDDNLPLEIPNTYNKNTHQDLPDNSIFY